MSKQRTGRPRIADLLIEAVMVVFAVVVALGFDEWREERQMRQYARQAQEAVVTEMRANLAELDSLGTGLEAMAGRLGSAVRAGNLEPLGGDVGLSLPEISSAAWQSAQVSQAATYIDYDWMIRVGRAYEAARIYQDVEYGIVDVMAGIIARTPSMEAVEDLFGRVVLLVDLQGDVQQRFRGLVETPAESR
jgi:hypothetical protein